MTDPTPAPLEPCPFCAVTLQQFLQDSTIYEHPKNGCWADSLLVGPKHHATWNRRVHPPATPGMDEDLQIVRSELDDLNSPRLSQRAMDERKDAIRAFERIKDRLRAALGKGSVDSRLTDGGKGLVVKAGEDPGVIAAAGGDSLSLSDSQVKDDGDGLDLDELDQQMTGLYAGEIGFEPLIEKIPALISEVRRLRATLQKGTP